MFKIKVIMVAVGILALLVLGVACGNGEEATTPTSDSVADTSASVGQPASTGAPVSSQAVAPAPATVFSTTDEAAVEPSPVLASSSRFTGSVPVPAQAQGGSSDAGIWVTGQGTITLEPDLVLLNIGVETMADTVSIARGDAAKAMAAIVDAVKARGLEDADIQTVSFNIWPRYEYPEVLVDGNRTRKQTLVGYTVSNTARIKVRDIDAVGEVIDDVTVAGGDFTRINGINFTIEDTSGYMNQLREDAVNDAIAKAEQFAELTGVIVGGLVFISETGGGSPVMQNFGADDRFMIAKAESVSTSISGGELELKLSVQAVFGIVQ
jgi:uncharacterized protein YggE